MENANSTMRWDANTSEALNPYIWKLIESDFEKLRPTGRSRMFDKGESELFIRSMQEKGVEVVSNAERVSRQHMWTIRMTNFDMMMENYDYYDDHRVGLLPYARSRYGGRMLVTFGSEVSVDSLVGLLRNIDERMPEIIAKAKNLLLEAQKKEMSQKMKMSAMEAMVRTTLEPLGVKYELNMGKRNAILELKINGKQTTKFRLGYNNFMDKVAELPNFVLQINDLVKRMGAFFTIRKQCDDRDNS